MEREEERQWNELRDAAYKEADKARDTARQKLEVNICLAYVLYWQLESLLPFSALSQS